MKTYSSSKRVNMIGATVETLMHMLSQNTMAYNVGLSEEQVDQMCTTAIQTTARSYGVTDSTVYSKCVREIGFKDKAHFVHAVVYQMARVSNELYYAIIHHLPSSDNTWDIEKMLGLPFNYCY